MILHLPIEKFPIFNNPIDVAKEAPPRPPWPSSSQGRIPGSNLHVRLHVRVKVTVVEGFRRVIAGDVASGFGLDGPVEIFKFLGISITTIDVLHHCVAVEGLVGRFYI